MKACYVALNSASDIILILDGLGYVVFANDEFLKTFGVDKYEDVLQTHCHNVTCLSSQPQIWDRVVKGQSWYGKCGSNCDVAVVPMMNGGATPKHYICNIKKSKEFNADTCSG